MRPRISSAELEGWTAGPKVIGDRVDGFLAPETSSPPSASAVDNCVSWRSPSTTGSR